MIDIAASGTVRPDLCLDNRLKHTMCTAHSQRNLHMYNRYAFDQMSKHNYPHEIYNDLKKPTTSKDECL